MDKKAVNMLKPQHWISHSLYQKNLISSLKLLCYYKDRINEYSDLIDKLFYLNLDSAYQVLAPLYSNTGRPAIYQAEILRSLAAMDHLRIHSITNWVKKLKTDRVLAILYVALTLMIYPVSVLSTTSWIESILQIQSLAILGPLIKNLLKTLKRVKSFLLNIPVSLKLWSIESLMVELSGDPIKSCLLSFLKLL